MSKRGNRYKIKMKSLNRCPNCGKPLEDPNFISCVRCRQKDTERTRIIRLNNPEKANRDAKRVNVKVKLEVMDAYGGYCQCCKEDRQEFLTIDHIKGNGAAHRREIFGSPRSGGGWYRWLRRNGFPPGYRVLCFNCNFAVWAFGTCPHKNTPSLH